MFLHKSVTNTINEVVNTKIKHIQASLTWWILLYTLNI